MNDFTQYNLPEFLQTNLTKMGYTQPTTIQEKAIPLIMDNQDLLASAHTGTGKTGAFLIPLIAKLNPEEAKDNHILVLSPTRELAAQINKVAKEMLEGSPFKSVLLIGGEDMRQQIMSLKKGSAVIIATPGRMNDHLERNTVRVDQISSLILDETDRMLDMGFGIQIDEIMTHLPEERQTLMFSATLPHGIVKLSAKYLKNPQRIAADAVNTVIDTIKQETLETRNKKDSLIDLVNEAEDSVLVFVNTREHCELIQELLSELDISAACLHGGLRQHKRTRVIQQFRNSRVRVLVATDVAARGLDIPHLKLVINYDLPINPEDYIHRIGRTGRAEQLGRAVSLISYKEQSKWRQIQDFLNGKQTQSSGFRSNNTRSSFDRRPSSTGAKPWHNRSSSAPSSSYRGNAGERTGGGERGPSRFKTDRQRSY